MQEEKKKRKSSANKKTEADPKTATSSKKTDDKTRDDKSSQTATKTRSTKSRASSKTKASQDSANTAVSDKKTKATTRATNKSGRLKPTPQSSPSHGYLIAAVLILLGAVIFLMLFTFSASDLASEAESTLNLFGIVGAWVANILLTLFGLAGFTFPAFLILKGITTFCGRPIDVKPSELIGMTLLLATASPLLALRMKGVQVLDHLPGGVLGSWEAEFAAKFISEPMFTAGCAALGILAILLATDTSLKSFTLGIFRILATIFIHLGRLIAAPFVALHAFITRPRLKKNESTPVEDTAAYDPYDDLSTNDLLGQEDAADEDTASSASIAEGEPKTQIADPAQTQANAAPSTQGNPSAAEEVPMPAPCSAEEIAEKLDADDDLCCEDPSEEETSDTEGEDAEEDSPDLQTEAGIASLLAKVLPGKSRPRSARRSHSVPAIEPEFDFNSIVKPEDIQPKEEADAVSEDKPPMTTGILGNWKPRAIGKSGRDTAEDANAPAGTRESSLTPSPVLTGEQKSFAPEVVMDTLALPQTQFKPRNITNDILAQCDESIPSQLAVKTGEEKTVLPSAKTRPAEQKREQCPDEQKTGCAASAELAALVQNMTSGERPQARDIQTSPSTRVADQDIDAFFRSGNVPSVDAERVSSTSLASRIRQSGLLEEIDVTPSPRTRVRDIGTASIEIPTPKTSASYEAPSDTDRPTRAFSIPTNEKTDENEKSTRTFSAVQDVAQKSENECPTRAFSVVSDEKTEDKNEKSTKVFSVAQPPADDKHAAPPKPIVSNDAATRIPTNPQTAIPSFAPPASHSGFDVAEARKRASEEDINEAERVRQQSQEKKPYQRPPLSILNYNPTTQKGYTQEELEDISTRIKEKFAEFKLTGEITHVCPGPVVTRFEFKPDPGIKVSRFQDLAQDLMMALEIISVRILAPIPGKGVVGIEIPNEHRNTIYLKEVLACDAFLHNKSVLTMALGQDTEGTPFVTNLAKMPHILVAGTTGSGKSVGINTMLCSLLYNATPEDVRLILVDPKCLELSIYKDIPHLLTPPITTPAETSAALDWACEEMERRYRLLQDIGVRNIENYNDVIQKAQEHPEDADPRILEKLEQRNDDNTPKHAHLSYIVIVIDEFADLMMVAKKEIETQVARLAQKARAAGINMILATQRPSTNVITGVIKANFPARLAFKVQAVVDSQTILGHKGAEALLGRGDSIFQDPSTGLETRVHGCFVSDEEVQAVVDYLHTQGKPEYDPNITASQSGDNGDPSASDDDAASKDDIHDDPAYARAIELIRQTRKASTSYLQRELGIGYPKAGRIISQLERDGMIGPADSKHNREVFI